MAFQPIDVAARERIRTDLEANLCVEAGAGTGKTTVLVNRIVEILKAGDGTVDDVAVITFTEAAASELSARVREGLEEALMTASEVGELDRVQQAINSLHRAHIETIHAFATNLLRERPVEAGLDPSFEVLDGLAARISFDDAYQDWLVELLSEGRPEIERAIHRGFDLTEIHSLVSVVHRSRSLLPLMRETAPAPDLASFVTQAQVAAAELRHLLVLGERDENAVAQMEQIVQFAERLTEAAEDPPLLERTILFRAPKIKDGAGAQTHWDDAAHCRRSKALRREVKGALTAVQAALKTEAIVGVLPLAELFVAAYETKRKREGKADFDDLLEWSRDLLASSPEARQYFRRRFKTILVDEFQDTDPIQVEIALCIASDSEPGEHWTDLLPRAGSITIVGDPKQSIYRFRRADIAVYDAVRHGPLRDGAEQLVQNFRSVKGVLDWVNSVFDRVFVAEEGVQPANTRLEVGTASRPDESRSVCVVQGDPQVKAAEIRAEEGRLLAGSLRRIVEEQWPVRDQATDELRPATYGDIVVLVPRRTELDVLISAFRRSGLPVHAESGRSFFQRQEVHDLSSLLRAIDDPLDQIALVAALRSTALACSDEEIYVHTAAGNRLDYRLPSEGGPESVTEALELLRDLHDLRSRVSLAQLVRTTLERTRLVEIALAGWDGQQAAANLVKLAEQARAFSASGAGGLRAFARWLAEQRASSDVAEASVAEETEEVIQIMTIHASKGLEFPVVALPNLGTSPRNDVEPVPDRTARRLHLRIGSAEINFKTPGFDVAWAFEEQRRAAEEKRLLYVATTRARDYLVIPVATTVEKAGPMLTDLWPSLPERDPEQAETVVAGCFLIDGDALPQVPDDEPPLPETVVAAVVDAALEQRDAWEISRAEVVRVARDELKIIPATRDEGDQPVSAALLGADDAPLIVGDGPPLEKGEALHRILELIDLAEPGDVEETTRSVCRVAGLDEHVDEVQQMVEACLGSDAVARALAAPAYWREVPYTRRIDGGYATGRIDLVFQEGDELVVVDWKSDTIAPSQAQAAAEGHRVQAEAYAASLTAATGMPASEVLFVFPRAGATASIAIDP